jgi:hypothetical protein
MLYKLLVCGLATASALNAPQMSRRAVMTSAAAAPLAFAVQAASAGTSPKGSLKTAEGTGPTGGSYKPPTSNAANEMLGRSSEFKPVVATSGKIDPSGDYNFYSNPVGSNKGFNGPASTPAAAAERSLGENQFGKVRASAPDCDCRGRCLPFPTAALRRRRLTRPPRVLTQRNEAGMARLLAK